jgi:hypothetical protein
VTLRSNPSRVNACSNPTTMNRNPATVPQASSAATFVVVLDSKEALLAPAVGGVVNSPRHGLVPLG